MAAPVAEIEVRWRKKDSGHEWRVQRFPPDAGLITLTGLQRGVEYEGQARSLGPNNEQSAWVPINWLVASQSSTPLDKLTLDLDIEAGKVVVDCTLSRFRLTLNANITSWQFVNVPPSTTLTFEIEQWTPGGHTITWPSSVVPVSGRTHVMPTTIGAIALITLSTTDTGKTWRQTVDQTEPDSGSGTVYGVSIAPKPATGTSETDGTTGSAPSVSVTATTENGTAPHTFAWARVDTSGGDDYTVTNGTTASPTFSIPSGTTAYNATQSWRCTANEAGGAVANDTVEVSLSRTVTGGLSVTISPSPVSAAHQTNPVGKAKAYPSGGSGTRTYLWRRIDTSGGPDFTCSTPKSAETSWSMESGDTPLVRTQKWRCEVTDATATVFADVDVKLERFGTA
jgi:hypothetical protein